MPNDNKPIIKASTPNSKTYGAKIDIYTDDPREEHDTIHITTSKTEKSAHIIDTTNGSTEHTDVKCYLTTACMRHMHKEFDDQCEELTILRWFRDKFVAKEDINHYYRIAPIIVDSINHDKNNDFIYNFIYENIVVICVNAIKQGDYNTAYTRYKSSIIALEEQFARNNLEQKLIKVLRRRINM